MTNSSIVNRGGARETDCKTIEELRFGTTPDRAPVYIESTSTLQVEPTVANRARRSRVKPMIMRYFFVQELLVEEGRIGMHYVVNENRQADR